MQNRRIRATLVWMGLAVQAESIQSMQNCEFVVQMTMTPPSAVSISCRAWLPPVEMALGLACWVEDGGAGEHVHEGIERSADWQWECGCCMSNCSSSQSSLKAR
mmetsp:Transcript_25805/g.39253  ORF Transcript_25805/g.39253 Transcript_25805/m.39253 type:complete len:104 (+) Transcript_25805:252-563(+)